MFSFQMEEFKKFRNNSNGDAVFKKFKERYVIPLLDPPSPEKNMHNCFESRSIMSPVIFKVGDFTFLWLFGEVPPGYKQGCGVTLLGHTWA